MKSVKILILLSIMIAGVAGAQEQIESLRMWPAPDNTRLVFDLSGPVKHKLFTLDNPSRVVVDISDAKLAKTIDEQDYKKSFLSGIRTAVRHDNDLRVVLDLKHKVRPKSFSLRPNEKYGHRLVIDLESEEQEKRVVRSIDQLNSNRDVIVAIDAGHGGEDPGALGPSGTREKDVVLAIAKRLKTLVDQTPGMKGVLTREGDYFIRLKKRVDKARDMNADLFVSIHADAFPDRRARGASVYILSNRGATSEHASFLAQRENNSDLVGGVSLDDKDDLLASVLLDLSQTATNEASYDVASSILRDMKGVAHLHKSTVERAAFRVLKAPDIPSILVETAFISNPKEERQLRSSRHQYAMANAIMKGVKRYFQHNPPPGTRLAQTRERKHVIARGDTLSGIARQYRVSIDSLRSANGLKNTVLQAGKVLRIPYQGS